MGVALDTRMVQTGPGERTAVVLQGDGTPVTMLHGSGPGVSAQANWWLNFGALGLKHRVIAPDLLGFGDTEIPADAELGVTAWVDHVLRLLDALHVERSWIVGNSLGGWIGLQLAIDHPDRVTGVISMGTGGSARPSAIAARASQDVTIDGVRRVLQSFVVDPMHVPEDLVQARYAALQSQGARMRFEKVIAARERDRDERPLTEEGLQSLQMPVLLIHGREDNVIPVDRSWDLLQSIPRADLHVFSHCGHWTQIERAEEFNSLVMAFIDRYDHLDLHEGAHA